MKYLLRYLLLSALFLVATACAWQPLTYSDKTAAAVEKAVAEFRAEPSLDVFFEEAVAYVIFPSSLRAGTGFGGAVGSGWLFEGSLPSGRVAMLELFAGANFGVQSYRSILFFRSDKSLKKFKKGRFEFSGQANVALMNKGAAITPSFNQEVAMFTQLRGGLLIEASVGTQRYDYFPLGKGRYE